MRIFILACSIISALGLAPPASGEDAPAIHAEIAGTHRMTLVLRDASGRPVAARVSVTAAGTGDPFWPSDPVIPVYEAYTGLNYFYAEDKVEVEVDAGWVRIMASRGPEFNLVDETVYISRSVIRAYTFTRLFDAAAYDLYSGDTHVHIAHGGEGDVYTITNEDLARVARAEELSVTCALTNGLYFNGGLDPAGDAEHLVHFGVEYRSALYGHMGVLGLPTILDSFACCLPGYPAAPLNRDVQAAAHALGATVVYAHPVSVDPDQIEDTRLDWPYSGLAREIPADLLVGEVDAYDLFSYSNADQGLSRELWFDLLNLGRRLPACVGTDAGLNRYFDPPIGGYRIYVRTPGGLDFSSWLEGLRAGRSFATNGPLFLEFTLDGMGAGDTLSLAAGDGNLIQGRMLLAGRSPATRLDLYSSGTLVYTSPLPAYDGVLDFDFTLARPSVSGWIVARVTGPLGSEMDVGNQLEAVTSPVRVVVDGEPMTPRSDVVFRFAGWIEVLQEIVRVRGGWESPSQMFAIWNVLETARQMLVEPEPGPRDGPDLEHVEQLRQGTLAVEAVDGGRGFSVDGAGEGVLEVFDVQGRRVYASAPRPLPARFAWRDDVEGRALASGLYFARVRSEGAVSRTHRLRILR